MDYGGTENRDSLIFVIDDVPDILSLLRRVLKLEGYSVETSDDAENAQAEIERLQPDLILLDIMMPSVDGYEVCRRLKKSVITREIPVIFITAKNDIEHIVDGFKFGGADYISKPFRAQEVCARVRTQLNVQHLHKERAALLTTVQEQAAHLSAVVDNIIDGIFTLNHGGLIQSVNPTGSSMFEYADGVMIGNPITRFLCKSSAAHCKKYFSKAVLSSFNAHEIKSYRLEVNGVKSNGVTFPIELSFSWTYNSIVAVTRDITAYKQMEVKLRGLSDSDPLTNIANRRQLNRVLKSELRRSQRHQHFLSVMIIDVDFFKAYNDCYGHLAGDACLKQVAQLLKTISARTTDLVARYGGEEFVVVLPETRLENGKRVGEKIRSGIQGLQIEHSQSEIADTLTVSIGIVTAIPSADTTVEQLLSRADQALYSAKSQGRNRVVIRS
ncbi:diguanylate cyclase domain-containing protein [Pseudomonadota bacterium]